MTPTRPVDLSATTAALWLAATTLLALLGTPLVLWTAIAVVFARLTGRLFGRTPSAGLLRRNERRHRLEGYVLYSASPNVGNPLCISKSGRMNVV
jgi:hypothetical protein